MDDPLRRAIPTLGLEAIGIGAGVVIGPTVAIILMASGGLALVYYYGGGLLGWVDAPRWPWSKSKVTRTHKHGIQASLHYHWDDQSTWGKPQVVLDGGYVVSTNAMLDVEVRNTTHHPQRISDLYMELRTHKRPQRVLGTIEPATIGTEREWYKRSNRRRVEWLLEPHSKGLREYITFSSDWEARERPKATVDNLYDLVLVIELEGGRKVVRLTLEEDIT